MIAEASAPAELTRASLLRDGSFVRLCVGQAISALGDKLSSIAIAVWILTQREDGAIALGAIFAVRTIATSLLLIAGVGLVLAAAALGFQGFRTSDPAALPHSDPLTGAGLALSVIPHFASLTWTIWVGRALRDVGRLARPGAAAVRA